MGVDSMKAIKLNALQQKCLCEIYENRSLASERSRTPNFLVNLGLVEHTSIGWRTTLAGRDWIDRSSHAWTKFVIEVPTCDLCDAPAVWKHTFGGLRCKKCPRPTGQRPIDQPCYRKTKLRTGTKP